MLQFKYSKVVLSFCLLFLFLILCFLPAHSFLIPDTGITSCFDDKGLEIVCPEKGQPFYGQDAHYGPGAMQLLLNSNGTISDELTSLTWEVKEGSDGTPNLSNPTDPDNSYSWDDLNGFILLLNATNYGGFTDWRIPTVKELETILDLSIAEPGPTINNTLFPNCKAGSYWTADTDIDNPAMAWAIDFSNSLDRISAKTDTFSIRAVRGGM